MKLARKIKIIGLHGLSADAWSRFSDQGYKHYDVVFPGFKYNLTDLAASVGLAQLPKLDRLAQRREQIWARYQEALADLPLTLPAAPAPDTLHARHLFTVLVHDEARVTRDEFLSADAPAGHRHGRPLPRVAHPPLLPRALGLPSRAVPQCVRHRRTHGFLAIGAETQADRRGDVERVPHHEPFPVCASLPFSS
jgi:dTDP-4-amino-4,6-dideoxygalactose transaminase